MKSYHFEAVVLTNKGRTLNEIYCIECLPKGIGVNHERVHPIYADEEWEHQVICCKCERLHNYMNIIKVKKDEVEQNYHGSDRRNSC